MVARFLLPIAVTVLSAARLDGSPGLANTQASAREAIAIVVHQSNPVNNLPLSELRRIFMVETQSWPHGRKVTLVLGEKGQAGRADAIRLICGMSEAEYDRHILLQTFRGSVGWGPRAIQSVSAMLRFVFNAPGAIGYVPAERVDATTKILRIDGRAPADPQYPLRMRTPGAGRPTGR